MKNKEVNIKLETMSNVKLFGNKKCAVIEMQKR